MKRGSHLENGQTFETGPSDLTVMFLVEHDWLEGTPFSLAKSYRSSSYLSFSITKSLQLIFQSVPYLRANPYVIIMSLKCLHILVMQKQSSAPLPLCSPCVFYLLPPFNFSRKWAITYSFHAATFTTANRIPHFPSPCIPLVRSPAGSWQRQFVSFGLMLLCIILVFRAKTGTCFLACIPKSNWTNVL